MIMTLIASFIPSSFVTKLLDCNKVNKTTLYHNNHNHLRMTIEKYLTFRASVRALISLQNRFYVHSCSLTVRFETP